MNIINKNNFFWRDEPVICFTIDVDWACEYAIKYTFDLFDKFQIPTTFFLTHPSNFLNNLISHKIIDAGIHPNFLKNSSQGQTLDEVVDYCFKLLPNTKGFRCHRYYDVNDTSELFVKNGCLYDSNLCTLLEKVDPFVHRSGLIRFPVFFEDGAYLFHKQNLQFKDVSNKYFYTPGLMIINIHPMHIALNSPNFLYSRKIKDTLSYKEWNELTEKKIKRMEYNGYGIRNYIINLLKFVHDNKIKAYSLNKLYEIVVAENTSINTNLY